MSLHEELKALDPDTLANALMDVLDEHLDPGDLANSDADANTLKHDVSVVAMRAFSEEYPALASLVMIADAKLAEDAEGRDEFVDGVTIGLIALKRYVDMQLLNIPPNPADE